MENGWVKRFVDGKEVSGLDEDESASWSKTRLEDMSGVDLSFYDSSIHFDVDGEYHQSDDYVAFLNDNGPSKAERIYRRIQLKLDTGKWLTVVMDTQGGFMVTIEDNKI